MQPHARRRCARAALAAILALAGVTPVGAGVPPQPQPVALRLAWVDLCGVRPELLQGATWHVQRLLRPAGVKVSGHSLAPASDQPAEGVLVVLMHRDPGRGPERPVAGVARVENGRQLTVWAFPPFVAGGLGLEFESRAHWTPAEKLRFTRALGLVVVHELGHALTGAAHTADGVMAAGLDRARLEDATLALDLDLKQGLLAGATSLSNTP